MAEIIGLFTAALLLADRLLPGRATTPADADTKTGWTAGARRRDLGVHAVPLDAIAGTVEVAKSRQFDHELRPDRSCAPRWQPLWPACKRGDALPPVSVYLVDGRYWLQDGHHRTSVLRHHAVDIVDAEVTELLRSPFAPG